MMEPNDYQIGGNHYKSQYQHWDWVIDTGQHYIIACATKYISRWRNKNGIQDLRKAVHYLAKAEDNGIYVSYHSSTYTHNYCSQLNRQDAEIIYTICDNEFEKAQALLSELISEAECEASLNYVDPDNNYFKG